MKTKFYPVFTLVLLLSLGWIAGLGGCAAPSATAPKKPSLSEEQRIHAVIERWIACSGGRPRLEGLRSISAKLSVGEPEAHVSRVVGFVDGRFRYDQEADGENYVSAGYDGRQVWQANREVGLCMLPERCFSPKWWPVVLEALKLEQTFPLRRLLPGATVNGSVCTVIGLRGKEGDSEQRWFFDRKGQLLRKVDDDVVQDYSDYRMVNGVNVPFVTSDLCQGEKKIYRCEQVEFDGRIDDTLFLPTKEQLAEITAMEAIVRRSVVGDHPAPPELKALRVRATSHYVRNGLTNHFTIHSNASGAILVESTCSGLGGTLRGSDGKTRWENSEILGYHRLKEGDEPSGIMAWWLAKEWRLEESYQFRKRLPDETLGGRKMDVLRLTRANGVTGKFYFDREYGWLVRSEIEANQALGKHALVMAYSDYRHVGALCVPFHVEEVDNGSKVITECESFEEIADLPEAFFQPQQNIDWDTRKTAPAEPAATR